MVNRNTLLIEAHHFYVDMQSNQQRYLDFLSTMAKYHKYDVMQQINLFFHAPSGSTAVAPAETWTRLGYSLKSDARAIPILEGERNREVVREVFDVSELNEYVPGSTGMLWQFDATRDASYMDEHFPGTGTMQERIVRICKLMAEQSGASEEDRELLGLSSAYIVLSRLGYDADDALAIDLAMLPWHDIHAEAILAQVNQMSQNLLNPLGEYIRKEQRNERDSEHEPEAEREQVLPLEGTVGVHEGELSEEEQAGDVEGARGDGEGGGVPSGHRGGVRGQGSGADGAPEVGAGGDGGSEAAGRDEVAGDQPERPAPGSGDLGSGDPLVTETTESPVPEPLPDVDYDADLSTTVGKHKVFARNMAAIHLMMRLEDEERDATPEEQRLLQSYAGFGGLSEAFDPFNGTWKKEYDELRATLSDAEFSAARASTLNAHYTPDALVQSIYKGLEHLGFKNGNILEPASGNGKFFQNMPEAMRKDSHIFGVELDPITARIAAKAHPDVQEVNAPYEAVDFADNSFDLAISNVPFGDYQVTSDPNYKNGYLIHDYFLNKMTDQVRPGGLVVAITSTGTMDKIDATARRDLFRKAELVRAYRLPNTVFGEAGTRTPVDIIILQKREKELAKDYFEHREQDRVDWTDSWRHFPSRLSREYLPINAYFYNLHQENVLGEIAEESSAHGPHLTCVPKDGKDYLELLDEAFAILPENSVYEPSKETRSVPIVKMKDEKTVYGFSLHAGKLIFTPPDGVDEGDPSLPNLSELTEKDYQRLLSAVYLRDTVHEMFIAERNGCSDAELGRYQEKLNALYDEHVKTFGRIATDNVLYKLFRRDPGYSLVSTLETFDNGIFQSKSDCFTKRTINPNIMPTHADTPEDALTISMQEKGKVDLSYMAQLMGQPRESLIDALNGKRIFLDFDDGDYKIAEEYLSGDVRAKIRGIKERQAILTYERDDAVGRLLGDDWDEFNYTPNGAFEQELFDTIQKHRTAAKGTSFAYRDYWQDGRNPEVMDYLKIHEDDRSFWLLYTAATGTTSRTPYNFKENLFFMLELTKLGIEPSRMSGSTAGNVLWGCLHEMNKKSAFNMTFPASDSFAPVYNFLYQEFAEHPIDPVDLDNMTYRERMEYQEGIASRWEEYKETYDRQAQELIEANEDPTLQAIAEKQKGFQQNLTALEEAKTQDIPASDIAVSLGTAWIPPAWIEEFLDDTLNLTFGERDKLDIQYDPYSGSWRIKGKGCDNVKATQTFGTGHINAIALCEQALNLKQPHVYKTVLVNGEEKRVIDPEATTEAQIKQEELKTEFEKWVWKDDDRAHWIQRYYNEHFNNIVPREFTGEYLKFPGMSPEYEAALRDYQKGAIAHSLTGNTLFAHSVGAGKTWEMICSAMESKRLGIAHKPAIIVPKQLIEQTGAEFRKLYPDAKILVATDKDFTPENRKEFFARVASQNWDAVIMGHTQFEKIPISDERRLMTSRRTVQQLVEARKKLETNRRGHELSIKEIERFKKKMEAQIHLLEEKIKSKQDDASICFEDLGIDRLYVDEAHSFKNLYTVTKMSNVAGVQTTHSAKSGDMYEKIQYLNEITNYNGVVFATGTPVSNSMTELYTMQRYLQPHILEQQGLTSFDAWASTYGKIVPSMELKPEGKGFQEKTRFSKFCNLPELMATYKNMADVKTQDMLHLDLPECEFIVAQTDATQEQKDMVNNFAARAQDIRDGKVDREKDNMLKVTNDGRALALDQRVFDPSLPDDPHSKVNQCVQNVLNVYKETQTEHSAQLIFCDHSAPGAKNGFSIYEDIKQKLIAQGVKPEEIAFIQEAKTDKKKDELFAKVRAGKVRVLIGGTENLGTGVNVQDRLIAIHDLEVPWKPSDLEQRLGRLVRSGNQNKKVKCFRYITKGTFDAYMWQILENKQKFISQIMTSKVATREAGDCDELVLSAAEIKALATGEPLLKEKMETDNRLERLKIARKAYVDSQLKQQKDIQHTYPEKIAAEEKNLRLLTEAQKEYDAKTKVVDGSAVFEMTINGKAYNKKEDAAKALQEAIKKDVQSLRAEYRGFHIAGAVNFLTKRPILNLTNKVAYNVDVYGNEAHVLEEVLSATRHLKTDLENSSQTLEDLQHDFEVAKKEVGKPFAHEEEFQQLSERSEELSLILQIKDRDEKGELTDEDIHREVCIERFKSIFKDFYATENFTLKAERLPKDDVTQFYLVNTATMMKRYRYRMDEGNSFFKDIDAAVVGKMLEQNFSKDDIAHAIYKYSPTAPDEETARAFVSHHALESEGQAIS